MCQFTTLYTKGKTFTGYKYSVVYRKHHYASFYTGVLYKVGKVPKVSKDEIDKLCISHKTYIEGYIWDNNRPNLTSLMVNLNNTIKIAKEDLLLLLKTQPKAKLVILKMTIKDNLTNGYWQGNIVAGSTIVKIEEIQAIN